MSRILSKQDEIRYWAAARGGNPMVMDVPGSGEDRRLLQLTFGQHALNSERNEGPDLNPYGGWSLCGWDEWFEELEKQRLVVKVNDDQPGSLSNDFRFVASDPAGDVTTDAALHPANITIKSPDPSDRSS